MQNKIALDLCCAIQYLQSQNVVHLDINVENIGYVYKHRELTTKQKHTLKRWCNAIWIESQNTYEYEVKEREVNKRKMQNEEKTNNVQEPQEVKFVRAKAFFDCWMNELEINGCIDNKPARSTKYAESKRHVTQNYVHKIAQYIYQNTKQKIELHKKLNGVINDLQKNTNVQEQKIAQTIQNNAQNVTKNNVDEQRIYKLFDFDYVREISKKQNLAIGCQSKAENEQNVYESDIDKINNYLYADITCLDNANEQQAVDEPYVSNNNKTDKTDNSLAFAFYGTKPYLAQEVVNEKKFYGNTDTFLFGTTFYELRTNQTFLAKLDPKHINKFGSLMVKSNCHMLQKSTSQVDKIIKACLRPRNDRPSMTKIYQLLQKIINRVEIHNIDKEIAQNITEVRNARKEAAKAQNQKKTAKMQ